MILDKELSILCLMSTSILNCMKWSNVKFYVLFKTEKQNKQNISRAFLLVKLLFIFNM